MCACTCCWSYQCNLQLLLIWTHGCTSSCHKRPHSICFCHLELLSKLEIGKTTGGKWSHTLNVISVICLLKRALGICSIKQSPFFLYHGKNDLKTFDFLCPYSPYRWPSSDRQKLAMDICMYTWDAAIGEMVLCWQPMKNEMWQWLLWVLQAGAITDDPITSSEQFKLCMPKAVGFQ